MTVCIWGVVWINVLFCIWTFKCSHTTYWKDCLSQLKCLLHLWQKSCTNILDSPAPQVYCPSQYLLHCIDMIAKEWVLKLGHESLLWCWRRLLRVPARRSNQSILKEISPGISLEGMMLKLKLHYFGHLMRRADSLEKSLMLGGIGGRRRRGQQRMRCWMASLSRWTWVWVNSRSWWWTGRPGVLRFMGSQRVRHDWATELSWRSLQNSIFCVSVSPHNYCPYL